MGGKTDLREVPDKLKRSLKITKFTIAQLAFI